MQQVEDVYLFIVREEDEEPPPIVESKPPRSRHPDRPAYIITVIGWLAILAIFASGMYQLLTSTATITIIATRATIVTQATITIPAHVFPEISKQESTTVPTSGHGHQVARQGYGSVTFYNAATYAQTIEAGTLLVANSGEQVVTDSEVSIPAGNLATNGRASVIAHALDYGPQGNIAAGDIYGPCCRALVQVANSAFSGGQNARDYKAVARSDVDGEARILIAQIKQGIHVQTAPGEQLLMPCKSAVKSDHSIDAEASMVRVSVSQVCAPVAYKAGEFESLAERALTTQATAQLGSGITRISEISTKISNTALQGETLQMSTLISGGYGYRYDSQQLAQLVTGKSEEAAAAMLSKAPGVQRIQVSGPWPAKHIRFVVLYANG